MVATSPEDLDKSAAEAAARPIPRQRIRDFAMIAAVVAAALTATVFGLNYRATELGDDTAHWADRLDTTTLAGAQNIGEIIERQSANLVELADNASLRLYLWALLNRGAISRDVPAAEFDYLRRLLIASTDSGTRSPARNSGFQTLVLLDAKLSTVLTTPGAATSAKALQIAKQAIETRTRQLVLARDADGKAVLYIAMIVEPPPGAAGKNALGGVIVSAGSADELLRPLIKSLPGYYKNDANLLLASSDDPVVVLSGGAPMTGINKIITLGFSSTKGGNGISVLQSAQRVPGTGWKLVRRIDADLALISLQQRIIAYFIALALSVVLLATVLYAWREHSIRLQERKNYLPMVVGNQFNQRPATREEQMLNKLVASLVDIIDLHDPYSAFHSARLAELCRAMGLKMGLDRDGLSNLVTAAMLANIGKISLPRELLTKRDELSETDEEILQTHVEEGVEILRKLDFDDPILAAIAQKQERMDGTGYPQGLAEDRITMLGRILAVANAYIALVSPRAYREALSSDEALATISRELGTIYDRETYEALEQVIATGDGLSDWEFPG